LSGNNEITIWGILVGAVLPLFGYLAFHWLATARESTSRKAKASNDFRESVIRSASKLPDKGAHWGSEEVEKFPDILQEIKTASEVYEYFLKPKERSRFKAVLNQLNNLFSTHLPSALSTANVIYPGKQRTPEQAKGELKAKLEELKSYASKT